MIETQHHIDIPADYDWQAWYHGNPLQRWWKQSIGRIVDQWVYSIDGTPSIVNLGCGTSPIGTGYINMVGVDLDPAKVGWMNEWELTFANGNVYIVGDVTRGVPLPGGCWDVVMAIELAEHVPAAPFWSEVSRLARPGATVIVATPDYASPIWLAVEAAYKLLRPGQYCDDHITRYTLPRLKSYGHANGLAYREHKRVAGADLVVRFERL